MFAFGEVSAHVIKPVDKPSESIPIGRLASWLIGVSKRKERDGSNSSKSLHLVYTDYAAHTPAAVDSPKM